MNHILSSGTYHCNYCNNEYKLKVNYDRHVGFCEFKCKSIREINNELDGAFEKTPSLNEVFGFMKQLVIRVDKLEKENEKLKQFVNHEKRKIDVLDWLNSKSNITPPITFHDWVVSFPIQQHLQRVFDENLYSGFVQCFEAGFNHISLKNIANLPICAFSNKQNILYVYDKVVENSQVVTKWSIFNDDLFHRWLSYIEKQFIIEFKNWCDTHPDYVNTADDHKFSIYTSNYQKILGGNMSTETRNHRVRQHIYNKIKRNFKNILEFEV